MLIIPSVGSWLKDGAVVPTEEELEAIIHALIEESSRVIRGGGNQYGVISHSQLKELIGKLEQYREYRAIRRGA
ncbi:MAG: hypothetical protein HYV47_01250 [Candidatus Nealsonbacteria bacterium]|nr:hypothetical protein [Candidatus Nealsonbacteria bacterium]